MRVFAAVLGTGLAFIVGAACADNLQVTVDGGALVGLASRDGAVRSFKGIPYAAPPVGDLRWRSPQPVSAWRGEREAMRLPPACTQRSPPPGGFYQREFVQTAEAQSEDCLYLNVWAPTQVGAAALPVVVFFHGAGFRTWSGSMPMTDGSHLARKGAIIVTLNFRLGAFGFLTHPELDAESPHKVSGNYGLQDQYAALRWVQKNIAAFGGDPARVTIFGQSAGGSAVGYAMASPLAKGLFRRAIVQSTSLSAGYEWGGATRSLAQAEEGGKKLLAELGVPSIAALRATSAADIMAKIGTRFDAYGLGPAIDGWLLPRDIPEAIAAGEMNNTEVLIGTTANEGTQLYPPTTAEAFQKTFAARFGAQAEPIAALYTVTDAATANAAQDQLLTDYWAAVARAVARLSSKHRRPAWVYSFNRAAPGSDPVKVGAFHCAELPFCFDNTDRCAAMTGGTPEARTLGARMADAWIAFARKGDPNHAGLPKWSPVAGAKLPTMVFDNKCEVKDDPEGESRKTLA